ncbi:mitochondrial potassium channel isoform X2 [Andrena cerasifolii]|uniref:mitochondrial potassium channel isoform X2 n=1 Tax=Andrena cerasifolii TaxID=2819439 RepID=UPI004037F218
MREELYRRVACKKTQRGLVCVLGCRWDRNGDCSWCVDRDDDGCGQLEPSPLPRRVVKWMQWYQQLTGLDTVEMAKQQVMSAQDKLFNCQDGRRQLNRQATIINDKLKEVYSELIQTKRDDPKYVQLTIVENKGLQEQARIMSQLNLLDKEEKDHFTQLATAIKEYHDSQTMNAQKYKYLSILASAGLAIISLIGSMIYNNKRIVSVRNVITEAQERNETAFRDKFNSLESNMNTRMSTILKKLDNNKKPAVTSFVNEDLDTSVLTQHLHIILGVSVILLFWKAFIG